MAQLIHARTEAGPRSNPLSGAGTGWEKTSAEKEETPPMARLVGVDLPRDKRMEVALTYIFGIGRTRSNEILAATGIDKDLRTRDLTDDQVAARISLERVRPMPKM